MSVSFFMFLWCQINEYARLFGTQEYQTKHDHCLYLACQIFLSLPFKFFSHKNSVFVNLRYDLFLFSKRRHYKLFHLDIIIRFLDLSWTEFVCYFLEPFGTFLENVWENLNFEIEIEFELNLNWIGRFLKYIKNWLGPPCHLIRGFCESTHK